MLAVEVFHHFNSRKDINKRVIKLIFNEMNQENAKYCLKLLYVAYKNIFTENQWQNLKHSLFFSYPHLLMK